MKISDHHVRSPLLNIYRACQGCHHFSELELHDRVGNIQTNVCNTRNVAMDALMDVIRDLKVAKDADASDADLAAARDFQRKAQFYLDFVEAENSSGFHASQETMRVLANSINLSRKGQEALRQRAGPRAVKAD